jgi:hypothetical protein
MVKRRMKKINLIATVSVMAVIVLSGTLIYAFNHYTTLLKEKDTLIGNLYGELDYKQEIIANVTRDRDLAQTELDNLTRLWNNLLEDYEDSVTKNKMYSNVSNVDNYESRTNYDLLFHICEKGPNSDFGHVQDIDYIYSLLQNFTHRSDVMLIPEYDGNQNWSKSYEWLLQNFTNYPLGLNVFEGGDNPTPQLKLSLTEISQACNTLDVRYLRFAEPISYYINQSQSFPVQWATEILSYAKANDIKVIWSEWKMGCDVYPNLTQYIKGYEDRVTVVYQTNNEYEEPLFGYLNVSYTFPQCKWGASVQAWYAESHMNIPLMEMPPQLMVQHAMEAVNLGAKVLQFEPYWYFFDNFDRPYPVMEMLETMLFKP